jgi:hypothetical protein
VGTCLRFVSNFTTLGYALSRLALIGQEHGKFVTNVSKETKMKKLFGITALICVILSLVKYFKYTVNNLDDRSELFVSVNGVDYTLDLVNRFPLKYTIFPFILVDNEFERTKSTVISIFTIISDVVNYLIFFVCNFALEIYTAVLLKKTLDEKMKNISSDEEVRQKKEKEKKSANQRMRRMVVYTVISNLLFRLPVAINSMFEIAITFIYQPGTATFFSFSYNYNVKNNFVYFCLGLNGCEIFEDISNFLYFISLSVSLIFYYNFDLNFNECFSKTILRKNKPQNTIPNKIKS